MVLNAQCRKCVYSKSLVYTLFTLEFDSMIILHRIGEYNMPNPFENNFFSRKVSPQKARLALIQATVTSVDGSLEKAGEAIMNRIRSVVEHPPVESLDKQTLTITVNGLLDPISFKFVHDGEHGDYVWLVHSVQGDPFSVVVLFEKKKHLQ